MHQFFLKLFLNIIPYYNDYFMASHFRLLDYNGIENCIGSLIQYPGISIVEI